ncbi:4F2 cell-surface antigen heavy chain [Nematolebias whitei]|uniref:4F2 cell-surface antigen heavy chain n=1 Tax=Nematolebias whitei TaxID=451745 RepID=UPI00189977F2|nr:4F2 cell-surface antigen heavy chain [Nematolebias whitei]
MMGSETSGPKGKKPPADMPLNVKDSCYGPVSGAAGLSNGEEASETTPLLPSEPVYAWRPLDQQELRAAAGGPGWRKIRQSLVLLFWISWVSLLAVALTIVVMSPRPVPTCLKWWQKCLFYRLRAEPDVGTEAERSEVINAACKRLPHLRSVGIGAVILEEVFHKKPPVENATTPSENLEALAQIQHLLTECKELDLRVVLDLCNVNLSELQEETGNSNHSAAEKHALRFWLEQGVAGFVICDTDAVYSVETLLEWRGVLDEFSPYHNERILVVKQTTDVLHPLNVSTYGNITLINVVMRAVLPKSRHLLSAAEVAEALETRVQLKREAAWPSWSVEGEASQDLQQILLVLVMTLPGSPAFQSQETTEQTQDERTHRSAVTLFTTLSRSKNREEALLYGNFTFLSFNTSSNASSPLVLAFLRSWGCVHFLVLLNLGPEPHPLDSAWTQSLPEKGMFVASTGMNRLGMTSLYSMTLQPHEAVVIKLFQAGSYA